jgi:hypothetical protein
VDGSQLLHEPLRRQLVSPLSGTELVEMRDSRAIPLAYRDLGAEWDRWLDLPSLGQRGHELVEQWQRASKLP